MKKYISFCKEGICVMIQPVTGYSGIYFQRGLSFKNSLTTDDFQKSIIQHNKTVEKQNEERSKLIKKIGLSAACFATAALIPSMINCIVNYNMAAVLEKSPKVKKNNLIKNFESLNLDEKIPTLRTCKSINKDLRDFLQHQVNYAYAGNDLLQEVGHPQKANRLLLYGAPGTGKSFFAKIYAKTIGAEYMDVKHSDFNSEWAGKGTDNLKKIFENILDTSQKNPDKNYVITFNEIDTIVQPIEKITEKTGGSYFMTKLEHRSAFLNYMDELSAKSPNVTIIGTTNLSPKNNGLDGAAMSRFKNIKEIPLPDRDCLFEAIKMNLNDIKDSENFFKSNESNLKKLAEEMEKKQYSFRNLENVIETSKNYYLEDKLKDKTKAFNMEYLNKAKSSISITDGELKTR